jgi:hypothetical protein
MQKIRDSGAVEKLQKERFEIADSSNRSQRPENALCVIVRGLPFRGEQRSNLDFFNEPAIPIFVLGYTASFINSICLNLQKC